jgi:hypothetical protein
MAFSIVIWTDTVEADFQKAEPTRLAKQIEQFSNFDVYIDPPAVPNNSIEIQICEILEAANEIHKIKITKDCPVIFHYTEGDFKYLANYRQLSRLGTLLHSNFYFPEGKFHNYWAYDYKSRVQFYGQELNFVKDIKKEFLCFNGRPDVHRWYVLQKLHDLKLLDRGQISFLNRYNQIENEINFNEFLSLYSGDPNFTVDVFQNKKTLVLDKSNNDIHKNDRTHDPELYSKTCVSLITETYADSRPGCFITEKSWKAIANCHLPIWIGQKGIVSAFKNMGYDVFDDIIDQSYDSLSNSKERWDAAVHSLLLFLDTDIDSKDSIIERLLNNQRKFLNLKIDESTIGSWL